MSEDSPYLISLHSANFAKPTNAFDLHRVGAHPLPPIRDLRGVLTRCGRPIE
jgi:hypothetical protein